MIELIETDNQKALFIDNVCQGVVSKDGTPISPYMKPIMEHINGLNANSELLFLGGGLYILPKWAKDRHHYVSTIEMDSDVFKTAEAVGSNINSYYGDALTMLSELENDWFDFILLDVWPNHPKMYCIDYFIECKRHLKKAGLLSANYICNTQDGIDSMGRLLATVFPNVKMTTFYKDKDMINPSQAVYFAS